MQIEDLKAEIERNGIFFEQRGMTPMESRVFSLLLLSDPPYMDFFAIQEFLGASKSAISNALNRLMNSKRVDYLTLPKDRKRYFKVNTEKWLEQMKTEIASVGPFVETIERMMAVRTEMKTPAFNRELKRIQLFFAFMAEEFPRVIAKWDKIDVELQKPEVL